MSKEMIQPEDIITHDPLSERNRQLWIDLWGKGYYVQPIGQILAGKIDYLIVSCTEPKNHINANSCKN